MLSIKQMQICDGLSSLSPYNNESKSSRNLCYGIFSFGTNTIITAVKLQLDFDVLFEGLIEFKSIYLQLLYRQQI